MVSAADETEHPTEPRRQVAPRLDSAAATTSRRTLLSRGDQLVVGLLVAASLAAVVAYWVVRGGARGELIEIETEGAFEVAPRLIATYSVDINSADWPEFEPLPGVGERLARRIVASREMDGPFESVDDLARVSGIGQKTVERLRPYLRADQPPASQPH